MAIDEPRLPESGEPPELPNEEPMQFDRAEFRPGTDGGLRCQYTGKPVVGRYYQLNGQIASAEFVESQLDPKSMGTKAGRFFGALGLGLGAAILGAVVWGGIRALTGYDIGIIAALAGWVIGIAVGAGSKHNGGILYRLMALLFVWLCISWSFIPETYHGIDASMSGDDSYFTEQGIESDPEFDETEPVVSGEQRDTVAYKAIILLMAFVVSLAGPVLMALSSIIMAIIMAFGFWEAWRRSGAAKLQLNGPFEAGAAPGGGLPPALPPPS